MDYVAKLSEDELKAACRYIITPRVIRTFLQQQSKVFNKICPGSRAKKLSDNRAIQLIVSNASMMEIDRFLNRVLQKTVDDTKHTISTLIENGMDHHAAILKALNEDPTCHSIPNILVKLLYPEYGSEYALLLEAACKAISEKEIHPEEKEDLSDIEPKTDMMQSSLFAESEQTAVTSETEQISQQSEEYKLLQLKVEQLQSDLKDKQDQLAEANARALQKEKTSSDLNSQLFWLERELEDMKSRAEDTEKALEQYQRLEERGDYADSTDDADYPYLSLCIVTGSKANGSGLELERLRDVADGMIQNRYDEAAPQKLWKLYDNKRSDLPIGFIGVWAWTTKYNPFSQLDNYIDSYYYDSPIEIIRMQDDSTMDSLIQQLKEGVQARINSSKAMFIIREGPNALTGLLCRKQELSVIGENMVKLSDSAADLPRYEFQESDILPIGAKQYFKRVSAGLPKERVRVRDPLLIVRDLLLPRISWPELKRLGATRSEWKKFHDYIKTFPNPGFYQELAHKCGCSDGQAKQYTEEFIHRSQSYLTGNDVESDLLEQLVRRRPEFMAQCKELLRTEWESEEKTKIAKKAEELERISCDITREQERLDMLSAEHKRLQNEIMQCVSEREEQEKLAADVEAKVSERIEQARLNAAQFIAEQAFSSPVLHPCTTYPKDSSMRDTGTLAARAAYKSGTTLPSDCLNGELEDFMSILQDNLKAAGVSRNDASDMGTFLYCAFLRHIPLLLCGPNAKEIVDAFSAARYGMTAGVVDCAAAVTTDLVPIIEQADEKIIILRKPLQSAFLSQMQEVLSVQECAGKMLFGIEPLAEELLLEPPGMYNYWLPFLTEFVVDHSPSTAFDGMNPSIPFSDHLPQTKESNSRRKTRLNRSFRISPLAAEKMQSLLDDFRTRADLQTDDPDTEARLALFPYAYATNQASELLGKRGFGGISEKTEKVFLTYLGEAE